MCGANCVFKKYTDARTHTAVQECEVCGSIEMKSELKLELSPVESPTAARILNLNPRNWWK